MKHSIQFLNWKGEFHDKRNLLKNNEDCQKLYA